MFVVRSITPCDGVLNTAEITSTGSLAVELPDDAPDWLRRWVVKG